MDTITNDIGNRQIICNMPYIGSNDYLYISTPFQFHTDISSVTINHISMDGGSSYISDTAQSMISPVISEHYIYFKLSTENEAVINALRGKTLIFDITVK